jgi:hypothetical protein
LPVSSAAASFAVADDDEVEGRALEGEVVGPRAGVVAAGGQPRARQQLAHAGPDGQHLEVVVRRVAGDADQVVAGREQRGKVDAAEGAFQVEVDDLDGGAAGLLDGPGDRQQLRHAEVSAAREEASGPEQQHARAVDAAHFFVGSGSVLPSAPRMT